MAVRASGEGSSGDSDKPKSKKPALAPASAEKFAQVGTGVHSCKSCGYEYNEKKGDPSYPLPAGVTFKNLPEDWRCPVCGAGQDFFQSQSYEVAGFEENMKYGLGTNTMTGEQKSLLIYGALLLTFGLFLSGYFLD